MPVTQFDLAPPAQQWINLILIWAGFGLLVGLLAKALVPGREPAGPVGTLLVGMIGSVVGPLALTLLWHRDQFNPIPAFVMLCETLFVTSDSTGMLSEAVTRGTARVEVIMNLRRPECKFGRLVRDLETDGAAHIFDGKLGDTRKKIDLAPAIQRAATLLKLT